MNNDKICSIVQDPRYLSVWQTSEFDWCTVLCSSSYNKKRLTLSALFYGKRGELVDVKVMLFYD